MTWDNWLDLGYVAWFLWLLVSWYRKPSDEPVTRGDLRSAVMVALVFTVVVLRLRDGSGL